MLTSSSGWLAPAGPQPIEKSCIFLNAPLSACTQKTVSYSTLISCCYSHNGTEIRMSMNCVYGSFKTFYDRSNISVYQHWETLRYNCLQKKNNTVCLSLQGDLVTPPTSSRQSSAAVKWPAWGPINFPSSSQNLTGALMRGLVRLSTGGGKKPDYQQEETDWLAENTAKIRKALLKDLRSWLRLWCRSSQDSEHNRNGPEFSHCQYPGKRIIAPCIRGPNCVVSHCSGEGFLY